VSILTKSDTSIAAAGTLCRDTDVVEGPGLVLQGALCCNLPVTKEFFDWFIYFFLKNSHAGYTSSHAS